MSADDRSESVDTSLDSLRDAMNAAEDAFEEANCAITINENEFKRLLGHIKTALESPNNQAALCLGKCSLSTLQDYITANELKRKA